MTFPLSYRLTYPAADLRSLQAADTRQAEDQCLTPDSHTPTCTLPPGSPIFANATFVTSLRRVTL